MSTSIARQRNCPGYLHLFWFNAVLAFFFFWQASQVMADTSIISADQALQGVASGEIVLIDIRSEQEWKESGLAKGAWPVSMHRPDFASQLQALLGRYAPENIALICATGGRSAYIARVLEQNGIDGVVDVSEGMFGNALGNGWIEKGLPLVNLDTATAAYDSARSKWGANN